MKMILMLLLALGITSQAQASATACLTDLRPIDSVNYSEFNEMLIDGEQIHMASIMTCKETGDLAKGLKAVALVIHVGAFYSLCTGGGVPVTVVLEGVALTTHAAEFVVENLPCVDTDSQQQKDELRRLSEEVACLSIRQQGGECNGPLAKEPPPYILL